MSPALQFQGRLLKRLVAGGFCLEVHQELYRLGPAEHGLPCVPHCHRPLEGTNVLHVPTEQCLGLRRPPIIEATLLDQGIRSMSIEVVVILKLDAARKTMTPSTCAFNGARTIAMSTMAPCVEPLPRVSMRNSCSPAEKQRYFPRAYSHPSPCTMRSRLHGYCTFSPQRVKDWLLQGGEAGAFRLAAQATRSPEVEHWRRHWKSASAFFFDSRMF